MKKKKKFRDWNRKKFCQRSKKNPLSNMTPQGHRTSLSDLGSKK